MTRNSRKKKPDGKLIDSHCQSEDDLLRQLKAGQSLALMDQKVKLALGKSRAYPLNSARRNFSPASFSPAFSSSA